MIAKGAKAEDPSPPRGSPAVAEGRYKIGTAARIAGVKPTTLRNWELRFGLLRPVRGPGGQRLYTEEDVQVLRAVREALAEGASIGEIALRGRDELVAAQTAPAPPVPETGAAASPAASPEAQPDAQSYVEELLGAAMQLDSKRLQRGLDEAIERHDPRFVLSAIAEPVSKELGRRWLAGECGVASEHLATAAIRSRLQHLVERGQQEVRADAILAFTCCLPDELHELGALRVAYDLTRLGIRVTHLGSTLPLEDLELAVRKLRPAFVFVSVTRPATLEAHKPRLVEFVRRWDGEVVFVIGGAAVQSGDPDLDLPNLRVHDPHRDLQTELRALVKE